MKEQFIPKEFKPEAMRWITKMVQICNSYAAQGYRLSLRQVYYQLVANHNLPNREQSYKTIGNLLSDARLAGLVDWDMIEDRNRETITNSHWDTPADIIRTCANQYRVDLWADQPVHVEVMVEKAALEGIMEPACRRWDIPFTSNRGYSSSSALYESGQRLSEKLGDEERERVVVLYFGDHDPSGLDMVRDVRERLGLFSGEYYYSTFDKDIVSFENRDRSGMPVFEVRHMALKMAQVETYNPPPNPAKITDSRAGAYIRKWGAESWELDALEPTVLVRLIDDEVGDLVDWPKYDAAQERQAEGRRRLTEIAEAEAGRGA